MTAAVCKEGLEGTITNYVGETFKSSTFNNGTGFLRLSEIENLELYFAHPDSSWERGSNEISNGIIREFRHKYSSISDITDEELLEIQDYLNDQPRK